jgi:hypothetical protein
MNKFFLVFISMIFSYCKSDSSIIPENARLITSDKVAFENCDSIYKEGKFLDGFHYGGYGSTFLNGVKMKIYPSLRQEGIYPACLLFSIVTQDSMILQGWLSTFDLDLSKNGKIIFLSNKGELSTYFNASRDHYSTFGKYHIKNFEDHQSYIKIVEMDKYFRLKARFNLVFEADEASKTSLKQAGYPLEITISDGIVMAGFLPKNNN